MYLSFCSRPVVGLFRMLLHGLLPCQICVTPQSPSGIPSVFNNELGDP